MNSGPNSGAHTDDFTIVTLANLPGSTTIHLTDYPVTSGGGAIDTGVGFGSLEGIIDWTTPVVGIPAGTVVTFSLTAGGNSLTVDPSSGIGSAVINSTLGWTSTSSTGSPFNNAVGDNLIIYTGSTASPTYIYGFLNSGTSSAANGTSGFHSSTESNTPQESEMPSGLLLSNNSNAATALAFNGALHEDNMHYNGTLSGSKNDLLTAIGNRANWSKNATIEFDLSIGGTIWTGTNPIFTLGSSNNTPTDISLSPSSVGQSTTGLNATVGTLSSTDADVGDSHMYTLVNGTGDTDNGNFNISGTTLRTNGVLAANTYSIRVNTNDGTDDFAKAISVTITDDIAPTLINQALTQTDVDDLQITYQSNETGTLYYVVTTNSSTPTQAQILAGNDQSGTSTNVVSSGNAAVTVTGSNQTIALNGLTLASTTYHVFIYEEDSIGNESSVVTNSAAVDATAPTLINQALAQTNSDDLQITYQSNETGTLYYVVTTNSSTPTQAQILAGNDQSGTSTNVVSSGNAAVTVTGSNQTIALNGLTLASTTYHVFIYEEDSIGNESSVVTNSAAVDATAPTLINQALAQTDSDDLQITYQSNETGTLYYVVTTNSSTPTQAQILAGNDQSGTSTNVVSSGNAAVTVTGSNQTIALNGLTLASTTYHVFIYEEDSIGNESSVVTNSAAVDATAPTLINQALAQTDSDDLQITYQSNETGTLYYVVTTNSSTPTQAQILAGNDQSGTSTNVVSSGNAAVTVTGSNQTIALNGLTLASTTYHVFIYEEDSIGNESSVVTNSAAVDATAPTLINQALAQTDSDDLQITYQSNETGTLYYVVTTNSSTPTQAQILAGNDQSGTSTNVVSSGNAAVTVTGSNQTIALNGLTLASTTYHVFIYEEDSIGNESSVVTNSAAVDATAPTLINQALAQTDSDDLQITYQSNETGTLYYVVTTNSSTPTQAQILAGNDQSGTSTNVVSSGNAAVTVTGSDQTIALNGLTLASTTYHVFIYEEDATGNESSVVTNSAAVDTTAPSFENSTPSAASIGTNNFTLNTDIDEVGDIFYVVVADGATTPTSTEVVNGTGNGGAAAVTSDNASVSSGGFTNAFSVTGLTAETDYDVYVVARDQVSNLQASPTLVNVSTSAIPSFSVNAPSVAEGTAGSTTLTFTVVLDSSAPAGGATVDFATSDGTASSMSDYTSTSGTVSFSVGETSKTIDVTLNGDSTVEADETITMTLSNPTGTSVVIGDPTGSGTITNDDSATVTIANVSVNENDGTATVTLTLDNAVDGGFDVDVSTADNTATTADSDYTAVTSATETFAGTASETETFTITLGGDTKVEADELIDIVMSNLAPTTVDSGDIDITDAAQVTITNDDQATLTIADVSVNEDDGAITVTVTLVNEVDGGFDVDVSTADGTATTADSDYTSVTSQTLTFAGTASESQTLTVTPTADANVESDETVSISMSNLVPNTVASGDIDITDGAIITILNDDSILSASEFDKLSFNIYPNPASNILVISLPVEKVEIYDLYGKKVFQTNQSSFSVKHLSSGTYFMLIKTDKGLGTRKFIKN